MKEISIVGLALVWGVSAFAQNVPQCTEWQKGDHAAASCLCAGVERKGDDRALACGSTEKSTEKQIATTPVANPIAATDKITLAEGSVGNFDGSSSSLPDAPTPQPVPVPAFAGKPALKKPSLQSPRDKKIGEDSYVASSILFHAAGAFDVTSTIVGIKRDRYESEGDPVYLAIFGKNNDRNVGLITTVAVVTHLGAQGITWYLHREADKQGAAGHRIRQYLLDSAVVAGNGLGGALHIKEGRTWYSSGGGPL